MDGVHTHIAGVLGRWVIFAANTRQWLAAARCAMLFAVFAMPAFAQFRATPTSLGNLAYPKLSVTVNAGALDLGAPKSLWVAAYVPNVGLLFETSNGLWRPSVSGAEPAGVLNTSDDTVSYTIFDGSLNVTNLPGVLIYVGFAQNFTELMNYSEYALVYESDGVMMQMNLEATAPIVSQGTQTVAIASVQLDVTGANSPRYQTRVIDSYGQMHSLQVQLYWDSVHTWSVLTSLDGNPFQTATSPLLFNATGQPVSGDVAPISYVLPAPSPAYGSTPFSFDITFPNITEGTTPSTPSIATSDFAVSNSVIRVDGANLDANSHLGATQTYAATILDPNGLSHAVAINLRNTAPNRWAVTYAVDGLTSSSVAAPMVFNAAGMPVSGTLVAASFNYGNGSAGSGADNFTINLSGILQSAAPTTAGKVSTRVEYAINPTDPTTYASAVYPTVTDAQGVSHLLGLYFVKVAVNTWETQISLDGGPLVVQPSYLTFDSDGQMTGLSESRFIGSIQTSPGAQSPLPIYLNFAGSTQLGGPFAILNFTN